MAAQSFRDLTVYKKAFSLAMDIFRITKTFPPEEKFFNRPSEKIVSFGVHMYWGSL
jgi:hypothetical protein